MTVPTPPPPPPLGAAGTSMCARRWCPTELTARCGERGRGRGRSVRGAVPARLHAHVRAAYPRPPRPRPRRQVFTAAHRESNEAVAIKTIRKQPEREAQQRHRVMREVGATLMLQARGRRARGGGIGCSGAPADWGKGAGAPFAGQPCQTTRQRPNPNHLLPQRLRTSPPSLRPHPPSQTPLNPQTPPKPTRPQGHPHAVRLLDVYEDPKAYHLVFENLAGGWGLRF
jgi:hypothetical protein